MLESLRREGPLNVGELVNRLQIGQEHLSDHLACLKSFGLVQAESRAVLCIIRDERVVQLLELGSAILHDHLEGIAGL